FHVTGVQTCALPISAAQSTAQIPAFGALNILYHVFLQACYDRNDLSWEQNSQERWWAWDEGLPYSDGAIGSSDTTSTLSEEMRNLKRSMNQPPSRPSPRESIIFMLLP